MFDKGMVHTDVAGAIFEHYCFMFHGGVVHIVVDVILLSITVWGLIEE
jgi:hypothetical protein